VREYKLDLQRKVDEMLIWTPLSVLIRLTAGGNNIFSHCTDVHHLLSCVTGRIHKTRALKSPRLTAVKGNLIIARISLSPSVIEIELESSIHQHVIIQNTPSSYSAFRPTGTAQGKWGSPSSSRCLRRLTHLGQYPISRLSPSILCRSLNKPNRENEELQ